MVRLRATRPLLLALVLASGCANVPRPSVLSASRGLGPHEVVVAPGESACALAGRLGVDVRALRATNGLSQPAAQPLTRVRVQVPAEAPLRHRVRSGETLQSLASWYGHPTATLAAGNRIRDPDRIAAGIWLRIPPGARTGCVPATPAVVVMKPRPPEPRAARARERPAPAKRALAREAPAPAPAEPAPLEVARTEPLEPAPPSDASLVALALADDALAQATQRYDAADFEATLVLTEEAQRALPAGANDAASVERRARARWLAGLANAGLDRREEASAALREALALDPTLRHEPSLSPRILGLLEADTEAETR